MDTPEVKVRRRRKEETPAADAAPAAAPTEAALPPPPPAAAAAKKAAGPNLGRPLEAAQFHNGVAFGPVVTTTGISVTHFKKKHNVDVELRLVGPGVWVKVGRRAFVVPFANVVSVDLGEVED